MAISNNCTITTPLIYDLPLTEDIDLFLFSLTVDQTYFIPAAWNIQFNIMLTGSATLTGDYTYTFNLLQENSTEIIPFTFTQSLTVGESKVQRAHFKYEVTPKEVRSTMTYTFQLASISLGTTSTPVPTTTLTINRGVLTGTITPVLNSGS
ncbi:hypothetical protein [Clostridium oryzae]|uniref:Uncharacterized protein n=1 Tax=Clostridium oryzae TaxID=1450648 RepID=A0A1V4IJP4_9CLOT|nr:hypothetical protein [Clostridium oryzae]OPJ60221.1 hypothetical protein CLORY_29420 [Clostridium oryzae]